MTDEARFERSVARSAGRPTISTSGMLVAQQLDLAVAAMVEANDPPTVFRRGRTLVRVVNGEIEPFTQETMDVHLSRIIDWVNVPRGDEPPRPTNPPVRTVKAILAAGGEDGRFPELDRVVQVPVFASDGSLSVEPGYQPKAKAWYEPAPGLERMPEPDTDEITYYVGLVDELLQDFPFDSDASKAHAVALLLEPFVREMIDGPTPLYEIEAPAPGTGKGLLARAASSPSVGGKPRSLSMSGSQEAEWDKRILAVLGTGQPVVLIDNYSGRLTSASLCQALTEPVYQGRVLGQSAMASFPVKCTWVLTANNIQLSAEVARRSVRIRLDAGVENPDKRDPGRFSHPNLLGWAGEQRRELVEAALGIVRHWIEWGRPRDFRVTKGSFEEWAMVMGGILAKAGWEGFLANDGELRDEADAEGDELAAFYRSWDLGGWGELTSAQVAERVDTYPVPEGAQVISSARSPGHVLRKHRDQWAGGRVLRNRRSNGVTTWWVESA